MFQTLDASQISQDFILREISQTLAQRKKLHVQVSKLETELTNLEVVAPPHSKEAQPPAGRDPTGAPLTTVTSATVCHQNFNHNNNPNMSTMLVPSGGIHGNLPAGVTKASSNVLARSCPNSTTIDNSVHQKIVLPVTGSSNYPVTSDRLMPMTNQSPQSTVVLSSPESLKSPTGRGHNSLPAGVVTASKSRHRSRNQEWPAVPDVGKIEEKNPELLAMKILETGRQIEAGRIPVLPPGQLFGECLCDYSHHT